MQTLGRWLMGETLPPGISLDTAVDGNRLVLNVHYDQSWETIMATASPVVIIDGPGAGGKRELVWERIEPGHFQAQTQLQSGLVRGAVRAGKHVLPFGPVAMQHNVEWQEGRRRLSELKSLSIATGGVEQLNLENVWSHSSSRSRYTDVSSYVLVLLMLLFLLEALQWRTGLRLLKRI